MPPRLTHHNRRQRQERDALEEVLTPVVMAEYQRVLRTLVTHLRQVDQHRPQLSKRLTLRKADFLSASLWASFRDRMRRRIMQKIKTGAITLSQIAAAFWASRGLPVTTIDTQAIAREVESALALRIKDIEDGLRKEVAQKVVQWYNKPGTKLSDIIQDLTSEEEGPFSRSRAERVARTEVTRVNSLVQREVGVQIGAEGWTFQTRNDQSVCHRDKRWMKGPDGNMYTGCRELHGKRFSMRDTFPPDSTHPNCRCSPSIIAPSMRNQPPLKAPEIQ